VGLSAAEWIAIGAAAAAVVSLGLCLYLFRQLRKVRAAQLVLLGGGKDDLVDFAVSLQARMDDLHGAVDEVAAALSRVDRRVDGSVTNTSLVRYDAYGEMSGRQSTSLALLDSRRSGVVVSAIHHRDQARVYVKHVREGASEVELSPEELEAVETAMAGTPTRA
jgi:Protein of unknown function (DUF4446)